MMGGRTISRWSPHWLSLGFKLATHTNFDSSGRVIATERYKDVVMVVDDAGLLPDNSGAPTNGAWKLDPDFDENSDGFLSSSITAYNTQGHLIGTVNADGLNTDTKVASSNLVAPIDDRSLCRPGSLRRKPLPLNI